MDFSLTEEQRALVDSARRFAQAAFESTSFTQDGFSWESLRALTRAGFAGMTLPVEYGGQGAPLMDALLAMEAIATVCPPAGDGVQATNFGAIKQLATFGTPELCHEVLPQLLSGDGLITAGMSEPGAGSALTELSTHARIDQDHVVVNGQKAWNSHGPDATHILLWCRFGPTPRDIGAVLVPTETPGFSKGPAESYMSGEKYCALFLDEVRLPKSHILFERDGLSSMMATFTIERTGNAMRSLALAQCAYDLAVEHAGQRRQFGRPLCDFQGVQWKFADMRTQLDAARLLVYRAASNAGEGVPPRDEALIAKLYANEAAFKICNEALQIFGASGYSRELPLEYLVRRTRGWMIAGGSVEMMRNQIAECIFDRRFSQRAASAT